MRRIKILNEVKKCGRIEIAYIKLKGAIISAKSKQIIREGSSCSGHEPESL